MKALIAIALVSFSIQSFAYESSVLTSVLTYATVAGTSGKNVFLKAQEILKDTNEYNLSGDISPGLAEHIRNIQDDNSEVSEREAIDLLAEQAQIIIERND